MKAPKTKSALVKAVLKNLDSARQRSWKDAQRSLENEWRRARPASRFHDSLISRAVREGWIREGELEERWKKDRAAMAAFQAKERKRILTQARANKKRHRQKVLGIRKLKRQFENQVGNPVLTTCLWRADSIVAGTPSSIRSGGAPPASVSPVGLAAAIGNNTLNVRAIASTSGGEFLRFLQPVDFVFVSTAARAGMLRASSWVYPNGLFRVVANPSCFARPFARVSVTADMAVSFTAADGSLQPPFSSGPVNVLHEEREGGSSWGKAFIGSNGSMPSFRDEKELTAVALGVPVAAGSTVVTTISIVLEVFAANGGEAEIDLRTGALELNVPSVWLLTES